MKIHLATIHAAKGLEFSTVFFVGLEEGNIPHFKAQTPEEEIEERRLAYVAITRASKTLYLTRSLTQQLPKTEEVKPIRVSPLFKKIFEGFPKEAFS